MNRACSFSKGGEVSGSLSSADSYLACRSFVEMGNLTNLETSGCEKRSALTQITLHCEVMKAFAPRRGRDEAGYELSSGSPDG